MNTTVAIETLGCRLNQAESESLAHRLANAGYLIASDGVPPSIYILNTCTVTAVADRKCRSLLRRIRARYPEALVVAAGCYARRAADQAASLGPRVVAHGGDQSSLVDMLLSCCPPRDEGSSTSGRLQRTRSFVKIQDGCNTHCTYCIVPSVRGREKTVDIGEVLSVVDNRIEAGYKEIVLTGTNIGRYRCGALGLVDLVRRILDGTSVARLRLSSLQPHDITPPLLSLFKEPRLCPHVHLPLQSGSPTVLRRMGRTYSIEEYRHAFQLLTDGVPNVSLTTDVIAGSPAETDEEHKESVALCRSLGFSALHVFPYSVRPGTPAARMRQVDAATKMRRSDEFLALAKQARQCFQMRFVGRPAEVLWEGRVEGTIHTWSGLTSNYIRVRADSVAPLTNTILPATLESSCGDHVRATIVPNLEAGT